MPAGTTPLDPDESAGLLPGHIATREQLDEWEAENILEGQRCAAGAARRRDILDDAFLRELHKRMFGRTWKWAGTYRSTEKNIGVAPARVAEEGYLAALRAADARDFAPLLAFVRGTG